MGITFLNAWYHLDTFISNNCVDNINLAIAKQCIYYCLDFKYIRTMGILRLFGVLDVLGTRVWETHD